MSQFDYIADAALQTVQATFGDTADWTDGYGRRRRITVLLDTLPDPVGDLGERLEILREASVRVAELEALQAGLRLAIGDTLSIGGTDYTVDALVDDDGIEQRVALK